MNVRESELYQRAIAVFERACELPDGECQAYVAGETTGDAELRALVDSLLASDRQAGEPLARAATGVSRVLEEPDFTLTSEGFTPERIGRFRIVRRIGEGGMGIVYEAEQENPRRVVAVKVVRPGMTTAANLRRFELEAEALARLEHPAIARIYETGMADMPWGRVPYFVMERVQGVPLGAFVKSKNLAARDRVELVARVCEAIEHAHGKGVIHRDLKSSNVLVNDAGEPKVLDFGVARLLEGKGEPGVELTLEGQVIGSLASMSPEQVRGDAHGIDARTDVYALGALAYELLTGRPPLDLASKSWTDAARIVESVEPPRLSTFDPACRGDLDIIVAKALEKDPARRYASASALAADFRRHLRHEPILAVPPHAWTSIVKFTRRNRVPVSAGLTAALALTLGTAAAVWKALDATEQREFAASKAAESDRSQRLSERQAYRANLAACVAALQIHDVAEARRRLEDAPVALRGWEWRHLWSRLDESVLQIDFEATSVTSDALSPDGTLLAVSLPAGRVEIWSLQSGALVAERLPLSRTAGALAFSLDGQRLLASFWTYNQISYFDFELPRFEVRAQFDAHMTGGRQTMIDARRGLLMRGLHSRRFVAYDIDTGDDFPRWKLTSNDAVFDLSPDGNSITVGGTTDFGVYDFRDGTPLFQHELDIGVRSIAYSPDGSSILLGLSGPQAQLRDAATGELRLVLSGLGSSVSSVAFSHDGTTIATGCQDGTVRLWDAAFGVQRRVLHGHTGAINRVYFTPDGARLVTTALDGSARVWSATDADDPFILRHSSTVYGLAFSPDGSRLLSGCLEPSSPSLHVWDVQTGQAIARWFTKEVTAVAWCEKGEGGNEERLAIGRHSHTGVLLDASTGEEVGAVPLHFYNTDSIGFDKSTQELVSSGVDGTISYLGLDKRKGTRKVRLGPSRDASDPIYRSVVAPDGAWVAASRSDKSIALFEGPKRAETARLTGHSSFVVSLASSPDGEFLASGGFDGEIRIWRVKSRELVATLRAHDQEVFALAFSPDGARLASGGRDRILRVWDTSRWEEVVRFSGHTSFIYALAFSPDGNTLASGGGDSTLRLWDTRTRAERHAARQDRDRRLAAVKPLVDRAFAGGAESRAAIDRIRAAPELDAPSREAALQEAFRRCVESRPAPR